MALVITNGTLYVRYDIKGGIKRTENFDEAIVYDDLRSAIDDIKRAPGKTKDYYVYDTVSEKVCWKRMTKEEYKAIGKEQRLKAKRKNFSNAVRRRVYQKAEGRCQLCGKKITYEEMTLDHIVPLAMCGEDAESNLQCACRNCNNLKSSILPEEFFHRINSIFSYQMEKKYGKSLKWKLVHKLLKGMMEE